MDDETKRYRENLNESVMRMYKDFIYPYGARKSTEFALNTAEKLCIEHGCLNDELTESVHKARMLNWKLKQMRDEVIEFCDDMGI